MSNTHPEQTEPQHASSPQGSAGRGKPVPLLVVYDISDNRRRCQLHRLLRSFEEPLQRSVLVFWLNSAAQRRLTMRLEEFIRAPHNGQEHIECIRADPATLEQPPAGWVFE